MVLSQASWSVYSGEAGSHCEAEAQMLDGQTQRMPSPAIYQPENSERNSQDSLASSVMVTGDVQTPKQMA